MLSQIIIDWLSSISPTKRRLYAARLLICALIGWCVSHVLLVMFNKSDVFTHTLMGISWFAIIATCIDIILTTDVKADNDKPSAVEESK